MVEQSTHDPKFEGSNPPASGRGGGEKIVRKRGDRSYVHFCHSWAALHSRLPLNKDPTVWPDGARPAITCIAPSYPWMVPAHLAAYPLLLGIFPPQQLRLPGYAALCVGAIQGKEGNWIQVLANLAPSSQIVGFNIRVIHEKAKYWKDHLPCIMKKCMATNVQIWNSLNAHNKELKGCSSSIYPL
jgi:hypothetical protein